MIMKSEMTELEKKGNFSFEQVDHPTKAGAIAWVFKCGGRTSVPFETLLEALTVFSRKVLEVEVKPLEDHGKNLWFSRDPYGYTSAGNTLPAIQQELKDFGVRQIDNPTAYIKTGIDYSVPVPTQAVSMPAPEPIQDGKLGRILEMFGRAHHSIKFPKIDLVTSDEQPIKLSRAGDKARVPGAINVTNGGRYGEDGAIWYGRIMPDGEWKPTKDCPSFVTDFLVTFNGDPASNAKAHGHRHGWCCFCGRDLTTKESTTVGYGPICADYYGLPWGEIEE